MTRSGSDHSTESLYYAREALVNAQVRYERDTLAVTPDQLAAYGSAMTGLLDALHSFTGDLCKRLEAVNRDHLRQQGYQNSPDAALNRAGHHLEHVHTLLDSALLDAGQYWTQACIVYDDIHATATDVANRRTPPEGNAEPG